MKKLFNVICEKEHGRKTCTVLLLLVRSRTVLSPTLRGNLTTPNPKYRTVHDLKSLLWKYYPQLPRLVVKRIPSALLTKCVCVRSAKSIMRYENFHNVSKPYCGHSDRNESNVDSDWLETNIIHQRRIATYRSGSSK